MPGSLTTVRLTVYMPKVPNLTHTHTQSFRGPQVCSFRTTTQECHQQPVPKETHERALSEPAPSSSPSVPSLVSCVLLKATSGFLPQGLCRSCALHRAHSPSTPSWPNVAFSERTSLLTLSTAVPSPSRSASVLHLSLKHLPPVMGWTVCSKNSCSPRTCEGDFIWK